MSHRNIISVILLAVLAQAILSPVGEVSGVHVNCEYDTPNCRCPKDADVCEFELEIESRMTLTRYRVNEEVNERGVAGTVYYFNKTTGALLPHPLSDTSCANIPLGDPGCTPPATVDAATYRPYIAINGLFPGPNLIVYEDQTLSILVVNRLEQETVTVHWHGIHQYNTPWMDGVDHVTQCGILPGASFQYIFKAVPSGTFWYHSHTGTQRTDGLFGGLIILEKDQNAIIEKLGQFRDEPEKHTINLLEWFPQTTANFFPALDSGNRFFQTTPPVPGGLPFFGDVAPDGAENGNLYFYSGLINGMGKHPDDTTYPYIQSRLSIFSVDGETVYRFRLIGSQGLFLFRFSIDEHQLDVIATDGYFTRKITTDYIIIHTGERFDFLLRTKPYCELLKNDFIIRAELLAVEAGRFPMQPPDELAPYRIKTHDRIEAILHYNVPGSKVPTSLEYEKIARESIPRSQTCTANQRCHAVNCPFIFHSSYNIDCTFIDQMKLLFPAPDNELPLNEPEPGEDGGRELFFNFAVDGFGPHNSVNGRRLRFPSVPAQLITDQTELDEFIDGEACHDIYNRELCKVSHNAITDPRCYCVQVNTVPNFGTTTRFVISNLGPQGDFAHPVHLHGHSFFVLKVGFPEYNSSTGFKGCHNSDLNCFVSNDLRCAYVGRPPLTRDYSCNNPEWNPGKEPLFGSPMAKIDPYTVRKDTVTVPAGGYAVIQFVADNPGYWIMHCHVETHTLEGMAVVINETAVRTTPPPDGMRKCGNFSFELEDFNDKIRNPGPRNSASKTLEISLVNNSPRIAGSSVSVDVRVNKPTESLMCRLRGVSGFARHFSNEQDCSSLSIMHRNLNSGKYVLHVEGTAVTGERAATRREFQIGRSIGDCTVNLIDRGIIVNGNTVSIWFAADGHTTTHACQIDQQPIHQCESPVTYSGLSSGEHSFQVSPQGCAGRSSYKLITNFSVP